ncbi:hypothetical protein HYH03_018380 [Edaphochlamys debaryana]|uniref:Uncharacterized protein n=1 Tax=Edaphochlamys debaryana TaxID=47281 RepID=A0A835XG04_9CHLO|nr:hypothetical protein HYH03_018380 [Edaphochlamys debaryana]|eukprot:KAG2482699.1 hypothetical protein HYH03_018380 [Edaphochlamys debaryana]
MLELAVQSARARVEAPLSGLRTGACDLLAEFGLAPFYGLSLKGPDRNYLQVPARDVPPGLPGDTSLYANPAWSLLRPQPVPPPPTEAPERVTERVRRAFRGLPPGGIVLAAADKGTDVTRLFMKNVPQPAGPGAAAGAGVSGGGAGPGGRSGGGSGGGAGGGKRRAAASAVAAESSGAHSGDTGGGVSHESKRQRSNY